MPKCYNSLLIIVVFLNIFSFGFMVSQLHPTSLQAQIVSKLFNSRYQIFFYIILVSVS